MGERLEKKSSKAKLTLELGGKKKEVSIPPGIASFNAGPPEFLHAIVKQLKPRHIVEGFTGGGFGGARDTGLAFLTLGKGVKWDTVEKNWPESARSDIQKAKDSLSGPLADYEVREGDIFKQDELVKQADLVFFKSAYGYAQADGNMEKGIKELIDYSLSTKSDNAGFLLYEERGGGEGRGPSEYSKGIPQIDVYARHIYEGLKGRGNLLAIVRGKGHNHFRLVEYDGKTPMPNWLDSISEPNRFPFYGVIGLLAMDHNALAKLKSAFS